MHDASQARPDDEALARIALAVTEGSPTSEEEAQRPPRVPRHVRFALEEQAHWQVVRKRTIAAIIDLREEQEPALRSPDLTRAALFMVPRIDEVPAVPDGKPPAPDDRSDEAEAWREQMYSRIDALALRRRGSRARRMKPYQTWRNLGAAGSRGGKLPGQQAHPSAWSSYLYRIDPDGLSGDSWSTPLGVALKRIERDYAGTKLWRALWIYTDPVHPKSMRRVEEALGVGQRQAERWLEAAIRRVVAEMRSIGFGAREARSEYREAEESEAEAWQNEM